MNVPYYTVRYSRVTYRTYTAQHARDKVSGPRTGEKGRAKITVLVWYNTLEAFFLATVRFGREVKNYGREGGGAATSYRELPYNDIN